MNVLTHRKRLKKALKELTLTQFEKFTNDVAELFEERKIELSAEIEAEKERQERLAQLRSLMDEQGISIEDLMGSEDAKPARKTLKPRGKVEPRYTVTDEQGVAHFWTGRGRAPKPFQAHFDKGFSKESCLIK